MMGCVSEKLDGGIFGKKSPDLKLPSNNSLIE